MRRESAFPVNAVKDAVSLLLFERPGAGAVRGGPAAMNIGLHLRGEYPEDSSGKSLHEIHFL